MHDQMSSDLSFRRDRSGKREACEQLLKCHESCENRMSRRPAYRTLPARWHAKALGAGSRIDRSLQLAPIRCSERQAVGDSLGDLSTVASTRPVLRLSNQK
jgi:hypothetical protein